MPNESNDIEARVQTAEARWEGAHREPGDRSWWGFKSYGDAPAAIGGGTGMFVWAETREEILDFIVSVLPYSPPGSSAADWDKVAAETQEIVERMKAAAIDDATGVERLNKALRSFSQIQYLGTFGALIEGDHPYAVEIRKDFRSDAEEDGDAAAPITDDEIDDFKEWLVDYGLI